MIGRFGCGLFAVLFVTGLVHAQDVPGIEICTAEKTMERRTSCLQSNVEFLQKTIAKLALDHQQKLDAAKAQIDALKVNLIALQKMVEELKAAQIKAPDNTKKADTPPAKDAAAKDAPRDVPKDAPKDGAAKEGGK
jgi:TolA-binding protein